jgi:hypothetical protein
MTEPTAAELVLAEIIALIDEGHLVRDTSTDADTPTFLRQSMRLVTALANAKAALHRPALNRPFLSCECMPAVVCSSHRMDPTAVDGARDVESRLDLEDSDEGVQARVEIIAQALAAARAEVRHEKIT